MYSYTERRALYKNSSNAQIERGMGSPLQNSNFSKLHNKLWIRACLTFSKPQSHVQIFRSVLS